MKKPQNFHGKPVMTTTRTTFEDALREHGRIVYTNVGVSMLPLLREHRDIMVIDRCDPAALKKYDVVLFIRPHTQGRGHYVLHRILRVDEDSFWIMGDNCLTGETVAKENVIGLLTAVMRGGRTIAVTDPGYRLYVRLWCAPYKLRIFITRGKNFLRRCVHKLRRPGR